MKVGDKYVMRNDVTTIVHIKNIITPDKNPNIDQRRQLRNIWYTFEEQDKEYTMLEPFFLEVYRPWDKLDMYLGGESV